MARNSSSAAANRAKLLAYGKASHVSQSGMAKLLRAVEEEGMPTSYSRSTQGRARASLSSTMTEYGKLVITRTVVTNAGGTVELAFQNPLAWLVYHAENSQDFSEYLREALVRNPPSPICPWNIVLYQDGVDPSDGLSKNHSRKSMVFYWSFLEFGMEALSKEEMWGSMHHPLSPGQRFAWQACAGDGACAGDLL